MTHRTDDFMSSFIAFEFGPNKFQRIQTHQMYTAIFFRTSLSASSVANWCGGQSRNRKFIGAGGGGGGSPSLSFLYFLFPFSISPLPPRLDVAPQIQANSAFYPSVVDKWVASLFIGCVLRWRYLVNACDVNAHPIGCWQYLGAVCFWQPIPLGLNLVATVLRDSLCVVSLLPWVADCYMLYPVCKVERFVLINEKLL